MEKVWLVELFAPWNRSTILLGVARTKIGVEKIVKDKHPNAVFVYDLGTSICYKDGVVEIYAEPEEVYE